MRSVGVTLPRLRTQLEQWLELNLEEVRTEDSPENLSPCTLSLQDVGFEPHFIWAPAWPQLRCRVCAMRRACPKNTLAHRSRCTDFSIYPPVFSQTNPRVCQRA